MQIKDKTDENTENFLQTVEKIVDINHIKKIQLEEIKLIKKIDYPLRSLV